MHHPGGPNRSPPPEPATNGTQYPALAARVVFITGSVFTERAREHRAKVDNPRIEEPFETGPFRALVRERVAAVRPIG